MDIERQSPQPERKVTIARLVKSCQKLADVVSSGRWTDKNKLIKNYDEDDDESIRHVRTSHEFSEEIGHKGTVRLFEWGEVTVQPVQVTVEASFIAEKNQFGYVDDEQSIPYLEEVFTIGVKITDTVNPFELPERVMGRIGELESEQDDEKAWVPISKEKLKSFKLQRQAELKYVVDDGCIEDYAIIYRYLCEGVEIDRHEYSLDASKESYDVTDWSGDTNEMKRINMPEITPQESEWVGANIDAVIETIIVDKKFNDLEDALDKEGGIHLGEDDHCRRAMAMLALAGHGYKHIHF